MKQEKQRPVVNNERGNFLADCWAAAPTATSSGWKVLVFFQGKGRDIKRHFIELFSSRHEKIWISWDTSTIKEELLSVGKTKSYIRKLIRIYSASILNASIAILMKTLNTD